MRKTNSLLLIAIVAITCLVSSCNKDDDNNPSNQGNEQLANEQNATEEAKIPTSTLETGIEIEGASKETGTPPSPNSNLNFDLNTDLTEAFQGSGLRIEFSSTESIAGAYIQFKDVDGNAASNYFNVSSSSFFNIDNGRLAGKVEPVKRSLSNARVAQEFNDQIEVDFGSNVPAGQFCYDICLYDASNNVSQIQTVCITVEAWGGNASIVGEWIFDKGEPATDVKETINCSNGQTIEVDYAQYTKDEWTFVLNEDGTYFEIYDVEGRELDYSATESNCSATYGDVERGNEKYSGNWAYNEEDQTLTVIDFKYENFLNASENEDYEDGDLYFEGAKAEIISGQLILTETDDGETYKAYFNRK